MRRGFSLVMCLILMLWMSSMGLESGSVYLRISNTDSTKGFGGAIYYFSIQYQK